MNHCLFTKASSNWKSVKHTFLVGVAAISMLSLASCATESATEPTPSTNADTNSISVDEFFTPLPSGAADDYYLLGDGEDDIEYSYFIDEDDYVFVRDYQEGHDHGKDKYYKDAKKYIKNGHGYGDHNHIHIHLKGPHKYHGVYVGIKRRKVDWTDSLRLTKEDKLAIDTAMRNFRECAKSTLDSFSMMIKPFRENFRTARMQIIVQLDSGLITRDSARLLLDSAIAKYETETELLRQSMIVDLNACLTELDLYLKARLSPAQYDLWVRHRGW